MRKLTLDHEFLLPRDFVESAEAAELSYVTDAAPGIQRKRRGRGFCYLLPSGARVQDDAVLARIRSLAIPPAWNEVWICPKATGHLQATGRDERGRKQYLYHARWREIRETIKFERIIAFASLLPAIRRRVNKDLARHGLPREKVLAAIVRLLESTLVRVGNEEYARENGSVGLTTMCNRHVDVAGATIHFDFEERAGWRMKSICTIGNWRESSSNARNCQASNSLPTSTKKANRTTSRRPT